MNYATRDFGEMNIEDSRVLDFVQPPFGFEAYHKYALIYDKEIGESIVWLQSLEEPSLCFLMMDPSSLAPYFQPRLPAGAEKMLGGDVCDCWVMMSVPGKVSEATVNLKSPVFINMTENRGAQIMLEQEYPVRFSLSEIGEAK